eukprot:TRINITY_DN9004_c0_g1_i1.p1 TRINITY_DN9004_c0_g1~~TRINITY_DN9004_c0_g1_i1.p1  ORF type:complete len:362 (-),score=67.50 TRINITY_DN9004_c0_g1_i1:175-1260(-)
MCIRDRVQEEKLVDSKVDEPQIQEQKIVEQQLSEQKPEPQIQDQASFKEGDPVILIDLDNKENMHLIYLASSQSFQNQHSHFSHQQFIGKTPGSIISSKKKPSCKVIILRPDPVLITETLFHKTQILYQTDIAFVLMKLNIIPGSIVVESGTGSGSLSQAIASAIQESGHLYTFEFNQDRVENAKQFFIKLGLKNVTVIQRDASQGFQPLQEPPEHDFIQCNSVFLDLPNPWDAIKHAKVVLKSNSYVCCFSPCIEQVQKNCRELANENFINIQTFEVLGRNLEPIQKMLISYEETKKEIKEENEEEKEKGKQINYKRKYEDYLEIEGKQFERTQKKVTLLSSGPCQMKGHTGYLTFAMKP